MLEKEGEVTIKPDIDLAMLQAKARERTVKTQASEYDIETLINKIRKGHIKIDPDYQRRHRWDDATSSRLIESLLLNIPIPTIYLSQDIDVDAEESDGAPVYSVIDGQQRLTAILSFMNNELALTDLGVLDDLDGAIYEELPSFLKRRLEERTINCLRIDSTVDSQVKYDIFERLNSGSVTLNAQELRNAVYRGPFNEILKKLAKSEDFSTVTNMSLPRRQKMEDVELVLRFFSLTGGLYKSYKPNMKSFLDESMRSLSTLSSNEMMELEERFFRQVRLIKAKFGDSPFAKYRFGEEKLASRFNVAVYDALIVAVDEAEDGRGLRDDACKAFRDLFNNLEFFDAVSGSVNDAKKLKSRISLATEAIGR